MISPSNGRTYSPRSNIQHGRSNLNSQKTPNSIVSKPNTELDFTFEDAWEGYKSSINGSDLTQSMLTQSVKISENTTEFGSFASLETVHKPSSNPYFPSHLGILTPQAVVIPHSQMYNSLKHNEAADEFSDFVVSRLPQASVRTPSLTLNVTKTDESVFGLTALVPPNTVSVNNVTPNLTDPEDVFEDFQACACDAPFRVEKLQKELPVEGWLKCLLECHSMLTESASVLSSINTVSDVDALLSTDRGKTFIFDLIEIYGIFHRIRLASSVNDILDSKLQGVFDQLDRVWDDLSRFVKNQEHTLTLKRRLTGSISTTTAAADALAVEPNCGVCATPVPSFYSNTETLEPEAAVISLVGRVYHASCANLWVNRVELSLPALRIG